MDATILSARSSRRWLLAALLTILIFLTFCNSLSNGFVFDDVSMIRNNPAIRDIKYVRLFFKRPFFSVGQPVAGPVVYDYYRPLVLVSYLADYHIWKLNASGYHLSNILMQSAAGLLCFALVSRLGLGPTGSFLAAAIFSVHPALADEVAGVSGRSDPLLAIFYLSSIYCYVSFRRNGKTTLLLSSYLALMAALLTKENAIAVPLILSAYELILPGGTPDLRRKPALLAPLFLITLGYFLWRAQVVPTSFAPPETSELAQRIAAAGRFGGSCLLMMVFPVGIGFETFTPLAQTLTVGAFVPALVFLAILAAAILARKKAPHISFFAIWFLAGLSPFAYLFLFHPEPEFFTPPHFLYFPSVGLAAIWGMSLTAATRWMTDKSAWQRKAALALPALILLLFCAHTIRRNTVWRDDLTFFSAMARYAPDSPRIHIGLAGAYLSAGRPGEALAEYARAYELTRRTGTHQTTLGENGKKGQLVIADHYAATALAGMGDAYRALGEPENSLVRYEMAVRENAFDAALRLRLGRAYEHVGRFDDAIASYERALRIDRNMQPAASSLNISRAKKEAYEQARRIHLTAVKAGREDSAEALYGEAVLLRLSGKPDAAIVLLRRALLKDPSHFGVNLALGQLLSDKGRHEDALACFSAAFASQPTSALAAYEIALSSLALGDSRAAELWAEKAFELEPDELYERLLEDIRRRKQ
jgi:tetratricopeptide (TPR) repeat protein